MFNTFVQDVYSIKTNPKDNTQKQTAKSILNNLMGRFGIRLEKSVTKIMSGRSLDILATRKAIISEKDLGNDRYLVTYIWLYFILIVCIKCVINSRLLNKHYLAKVETLKESVLTLIVSKPNIIHNNILISIKDM